MPVTVDHELLEIEPLGLKTVGQVLSHVQRENRLVVHLLIDGREPEIAAMGDVRRSPVNGRTLFIETAEPRQMALEVLDEVEEQLDEADRLKGEAVQLLQKNGVVKAMERLSGCFSTWHAAQESVLKTAQLLRIDLSKIVVGVRSLRDVLAEFTGQLRQIKSALESRDFVTLGDILTYETTETSAQWRLALVAMRDVIR
jgi:uncharacterized protein (UPF0218 family)